MILFKIILQVFLEGGGGLLKFVFLKFLAQVIKS